MKTGFISNHFTDSEGNPSGGTTYGVGFAIGWQNGPLGRGADRRKPNGTFVEDVISAAADRLQFYQRSRFACEANEKALDHLLAALVLLERRTRDREARNIEGTHEV